MVVALHIMETLAAKGNINFMFVCISVASTEKHALNITVYIAICVPVSQLQGLLTVTQTILWCLVFYDTAYLVTNNRHYYYFI